MRSQRPLCVSVTLTAAAAAAGYEPTVFVEFARAEVMAAELVAAALVAAELASVETEAASA